MQHQHPNSQEPKITQLSAFLTFFRKYHLPGVLKNAGPAIAELAYLEAAHFDYAKGQAPHILGSLLVRLDRTRNPREALSEYFRVGGHEGLNGSFDGTAQTMFAIALVTAVKGAIESRNSGSNILEYLVRPDTIQAIGKFVADEVPGHLVTDARLMNAFHVTKRTLLCRSAVVQMTPTAIRRVP